MSRPKYQVPEKVRRGSHRRKVSHALGNSRISGYTEELDGAAIRNRIILLAVFAALVAVGVYGLIF